MTFCSIETHNSYAYSMPKCLPWNTRRMSILFIECIDLKRSLPQPRVWIFLSLHCYWLLISRFGELIGCHFSFLNRIITWKGYFALRIIYTHRMTELMHSLRAYMCVSCTSEVSQCSLLRILNSYERLHCPHTWKIVCEQTYIRIAVNYYSFKWQRGARSLYITFDTISFSDGALFLLFFLLGKSILNRFHKWKYT